MIDDAQNWACRAHVIPHKRQIHAPDAVDVHMGRALIAQFAGNVEQRVLVVADGVADKRFADSCWRMQPVESVSHFPAADLLAHQGLEAQDLLHNPVRLFAGQGCRGGNGGRIWRGTASEALAFFPV